MPNNRLNIKRCGRILILLNVLIIISNLALGDFLEWAKTPPLGWNSWDCFGCSVTEDEVKANADYMAKHLKQYGWEYIVVDIQWYEPKSDKNSKDPYAYPANLDTNIDEYGRVFPVVTKHPSSADGKGFTPLAEYVHGLGLKFGVHMMRGIPKLAYERDTPILGTQYTAQDIADTTSTCQWNPDMYGVDTTKPGAQEYYNSVINLVAGWGVDYVKIDDLSRPYHQGEIDTIRKAIDQCGRPIVLSTSPGATPLSAAEHVSKHANLWRISDDFWDGWQQLKSQFQRLHDWSQWCADGHYPDADMLPLGNIRARSDGWTRFTKTEQKTMMIMWSIARSPLMMGGHMPNNDDDTLSLLTNPEVLYVNQHSMNNRQLFREDDLIAWVAEDRNSNDLFVALINAQDKEEHDVDKAAWISPVISRESAKKAVPFEVSLDGAPKIYLIVNDAGDGFDCDHADWLNVTLTNEKGAKIPLTYHKWTKASAGWGTVSINKSISGNDLIVDGASYQNGIGTHSNSVIEYELPEGKYVKLEGLAALDDGGATQSHAGATIQFQIYTVDPGHTAKSASLSVQLSDLGIEGKYDVRDLWNHEDLGTFEGTFQAEIEPHGARLYRMSVPENAVVQVGNPIIIHKYTADPAALVHDGVVYLYAGHDQCPPERNGYEMHEWLVFSSTDMVHWQEHPVPLKPTDFTWARDDAWAAQVIERNGKFYWYVTVEHNTIHGKAIGVAVSDSPTGPFKDARGTALITNDMTTDTPISWDDIDPTVFIDDDGQAYLFWGNTKCYWIKLKDNMIEQDGPIHTVEGLPHFTEAPWIHKRGDWYYLSYAYQFPEKTAYAMSKSITGPWEFKGILNEVAGNSNTNHQAIIQYKDKWYFIYHNGSIPTAGGSFRRSVCIDRLYYNPDGTMRRVVMTTEGVNPVTPDQNQVLTEKDMSAYLMVYFSDSDHSLHMALSSDGYTFTALNDNKPVIEGHTIAAQKGIRDPHITRGPDGAFYVAMTDLHIFGQREGYRETEWERDAAKYDWGNNRGFVLMKSFDLIHWTKSNVLLTEAFDELKDIGCAWAPQTIYDPEAGRMMLYFTMRFGHGRTKLYYAYTDDDFTKLTSLPKSLFEYPNDQVQILDADITRLPDGRYCMMYVAQENPGGIKMAFSKHINKGYVYQPEWIDVEPGSCEAPNVWKRIGEDKWVLMVDIFSIRPHNFGFYETGDFMTFKDLGHFNEGNMKTANFTSPKHGSVIHLTKQEAGQLAKHWGLGKY